MVAHRTDRMELIQQATGVACHHVPIIERLMSETILHSTLDWLTAEEFARVAREAHQLFRLAPPYFHTQQALTAAAFKRMQAEDRLKKAVAKNDPQAIAKAEERLALYRRQEGHFTELCQRLSSTFFPSENA